MRLGFIDYAKWDYSVDTAYERPLGGSQSALCYLTEQLANRGHSVWLANRTKSIRVSRGVNCVPLDKVSAATWQAFDAVIVQNWSQSGGELRAKMRPGAKLVLWTQHAHDQPAVESLARVADRDRFDAFVFVSDWQRQQYVERFAIDPARSVVLRNAVSPAFQQLANDTSLALQSRAPVLAYTSTPFRGLKTLVEIFPQIGAAVPDATLRVFSSMQVYQMAAERDAAEYGQLYERCRSTPGIEYIGSLPQPQLARELASVAVLAYPNTFAETSCIAVMEAMAAGCQIVTSRLGALPETTAGFAELVEIGVDRAAFATEFAAAVIAALRSRDTTRVARQVAFMREQCTWTNRAAEWDMWLAAKTAGKPAR